MTLVVTRKPGGGVSAGGGGLSQAQVDARIAALAQPLDADLTAIAALSTTAAGRALLDDADAAAQLTTLGLSAFVKTLMDDADASTFLGTLGVTTFIKTLLDDANAGAALTTLGVSAFIQTLLDDADAATARATLGVSAPGVVQIADSLLGADTASFDFTAIPATYSSLRLVLSGRSTLAATAEHLARIRFNNDSGANYEYQWIQNGGSSSVGGLTSGIIGNTIGAGAAANSSSQFDILIPRYSKIDHDRMVQVQGSWWNIGVGTAIQQVMTHWANHANAIDRVTIFPSSGNWLSGSRCTLYGML